MLPASLSHVIHLNCGQYCGPVLTCGVPGVLGPSPTYFAIRSARRRTSSGNKC